MKSMKTCDWCQKSVNSYGDHQNIMGAYTCISAQPTGSHCITLYHQTSATNADSILKTGMMKPGICGMAGPGIYFATTPENTHHKARYQGVILECLVDIGKVKNLGPEGDQSMNQEALNSQGYHSVYIPRARGEEYVVYDPKRIKRIQIFKKN